MKAVLVLLLAFLACVFAQEGTLNHEAAPVATEVDVSAFQTQIAMLTEQIASAQEAGKLAEAKAEKAAAEAQELTQQVASLTQKLAALTQENTLLTNQIQAEKEAVKASQAALKKAEDVNAMLQEDLKKAQKSQSTAAPTSGSDAHPHYAELKAKFEKTAFQVADKVQPYLELLQEKTQGAVDFYFAEVHPKVLEAVQKAGECICTSCKKAKELYVQHAEPQVNMAKEKVTALYNEKVAPVLAPHLEKVQAHPVYQQAHGKVQEARAFLIEQAKTVPQIAPYAEHVPCALVSLPFVLFFFRRCCGGCCKKRSPAQPAVKSSSAKPRRH